MHGRGHRIIKTLEAASALRPGWALRPHPSLPELVLGQAALLGFLPWLKTHLPCLALPCLALQQQSPQLDSAASLHPPPALPQPLTNEWKTHLRAAGTCSASSGGPLSQGPEAGDATFDFGQRMPGNELNSVCSCDGC